MWHWMDKLCPHWRLLQTLPLQGDLARSREILPIPWRRPSINHRQGHQWLPCKAQRNAILDWIKAASEWRILDSARSLDRWLALVLPELAWRRTKWRRRTWGLCTDKLGRCREWAMEWSREQREVWIFLPEIDFILFGFHFERVCMIIFAIAIKIMFQKETLWIIC